jgi:hypothetical protein
MFLSNMLGNAPVIGGTPPTSFTEIGTDFGNNIALLTISASTQAGDLIVFSEEPNGTTADPGTPTGFTRTFFYSGSNHGWMTATKIATSGDASSTVATGNSVNNNAFLVVLRPDSTISSIIANSIQQEFTSGDPILQTCPSGIGTEPLIVFGHTRSGVAPLGFSFTPTADTTLTSTGATSSYKIYNSTPSDVDVDIADNGTRNSIVTWYYTFT